MIGGATVLVVAKAAGWFHGATRTVVVRQSATAGDLAPVVAAKPLVGNGFQPAQIYRSRAAGVVTIVSYFDDASLPNARAGQGSGFVVRSDGTILTSAHVITTAGQGTSAPTKTARTVYVEFSDGDRVPAKVVGADLYDDVGIIKVAPGQHALSPVPLGNSSRVVVGQPVAAIGSPFGNADSLSVGVVSAIRRSIPSLTTAYNLVDAIQTDAPINHGNSGGPLFDARGRVIGINAQIRSTDTSSGFEGVGFAVPIDSARRSLDQIETTGGSSTRISGSRRRISPPRSRRGSVTPHAAGRSSTSSSRERRRRRRVSGPARATPCTKASPCGSAATRSCRSTGSRCRAPRTSCASSRSGSCRARRRASRSFAARSGARSR